MKTVPALLTLVVLCSSLAACGRTKTTTRPSTSRSSSTYLNDGDNDRIGDADGDNGHDNDNDNQEDHERNDNDDYHDSDDSVLTLGHAADLAETRAVTAGVLRYYSVAASRDGGKACSMMIPSLAETVPADYGHGSAGPRALQAGRTCPAVMNLLFKSMHASLRTGVHITGVRISEGHAVALLGSHVAPASAIPLQRWHGAWRVAALIGGTLP